ncbi:MAG: M23 family metallopeptidase, partial [Propionibacteriaceae bacterium]|nr:M23 family metallopeptidase [Propionibacteriaceae bacterium]
MIVALVAALALFGSGGAAAAAGCDGGMVVPLPVAHTLTSGFGLRSDPTGGGVDRHTGQDLAAPAGTPVLAAAAGTIVKVLDLGAVSYGLHVVVEHSGGVSTWYAHLSAAVVSVGQLVAAGDPIGQVGSSGRSTGPHLHFEVRLDGVPTDPALWFEERGLVLDGSPGRSVASLSPAGTAASCPGTPVSGDPVVAAAQSWIGTPY